MPFRCCVWNDFELPVFGALTESRWRGLWQTSLEMDPTCSAKPCEGYFWLIGVLMAESGDFRHLSSSCFYVRWNLNVMGVAAQTLCIIRNIGDIVHKTVTRPCVGLLIQPEPKLSSSVKCALQNHSRWQPELVSVIWRQQFQSRIKVELIYCQLPWISGCQQCMHEGKKKPSKLTRPALKRTE